LYDTRTKKRKQRGVRSGGEGTSKNGGKRNETAPTPRIQSYKKSRNRVYASCGFTGLRKTKDKDQQVSLRSKAKKIVQKKKGKLLWGSRMHQGWPLPESEKARRWSGGGNCPRKTGKVAHRKKKKTSATGSLGNARNQGWGG